MTAKDLQQLIAREKDGGFKKSIYYFAVGNFRLAERSLRAYGKLAAWDYFTNKAATYLFAGDEGPRFKMLLFNKIMAHAIARSPEYKYAMMQIRSHDPKILKEWGPAIARLIKGLVDGLRVLSEEEKEVITNYLLEDNGFTYLIALGALYAQPRRKK